MLEDFKIKLDYGKAILICGNDLKLSAYRCEISPKFLVLKREPNKIYGLDQNDFTNDYKSEIFRKMLEKGYEPINIRQIFREKIETILEKEVTKYINENINNVEHVNEYLAEENFWCRYTSFDFMQKANNFGKSLRNDRLASKRVSLYFEQICEGIIDFKENIYDDSSFKFDLEKQRFNITDEEIMKKIYKESELKAILAYEQYKKKKTPPLYNEIAKINEFLKDKKTVTFELHNGTKIKAEARLNSILDIREDGNIFIADRYSNRIIEGQPINSYQYSGTQLKCLKYGKSILNIQSEALKSIRQEKSKEIQEEIDEEIL